MKASDFERIIGAEFYAGVPDSQIRAFCDFLVKKYGINGKNHVIAANEGNCVALAAGYYMATGKTAAVYMQNSGEGNIINPVASMAHKRVYGIPTIFIIGWRGEPGIPDEPQHVYQGAITLKLLDDMEIDYYIVDKDTSVEQLTHVKERFDSILSVGKSVAFVIRKNALTSDEKINYTNGYELSREDAIRCVVEYSGEDPIFSTTGKASRELFEIRESRGDGHNRDFLTVGSMGHTSSIALGFALNYPNKQIWCLDGDGALLMHMGAVAVIGHYAPSNLIHIVLNNEAHESVGGMPTTINTVNILQIAQACGYKNVKSVSSRGELISVLEHIRDNVGLSLIEVKCAIGARSNLGRPTTSPSENIRAFIESQRQQD